MAVPADGHALDRANWIDVRCDEFEAACQAQLRPTIGVFLEDTEEPARSALFAELLRLEIDYKRRSGETSDFGEYRSRFPEFQALIDLVQRDSAQAVDADPPPELDGVICQLRLGQGTFGEVWCGWDMELQRPVAVKIPKRSWLAGPIFDLFVHEARAAAKLRHPGIVAIHRIGQSDRGPFLVAELIEGMTLREWMDIHPVTADNAAGICLRVADALQHAHDRGVVHRDLKPTNILIDCDGVPHVTDFGVSKQSDATQTIANTGEPIGTLAYMSPEQARGSADVDARTDVYALGVVLYELLAGRCPQTGTTDEVLAQLLNVDAVVSDDFGPDVPKPLGWICLKALSKATGDRYATAGMFRDDLERFIRRSPVQARAPSRFGRHLRRLLHPAVLISLLASSALVAAVALFTIQQEPSSKTIVHVKTEPPGAALFAVPLDESDRPSKATMTRSEQRAGSSLLRLDPGRYRVVALSSGQSWHCVERVVPADAHDVPKGTRAQVQFKLLGDGSIEWPAIHVPSHDITAALVRIPTEGIGITSAVDSSSRSATDSESTRGGIWMAPAYFTIADLRKIRPEIGSGREFSGQPSETPLVQIFEGALHWAEEAGGRLATHSECEWAMRYLAQRDTSGLPLTAPERTLLSSLRDSHEWTTASTSSAKPQSLAKMGDIGDRRHVFEGEHRRTGSGSPSMARGVLPFRLVRDVRPPLVTDN